MTQMKTDMFHPEQAKEAASSKMDALFDPERLRKNWNKVSSEEARSLPVFHEPNEPMSAFSILRLFLQTRFSGDHMAVLNMLMDDLEPVWKSLFDETDRQIQDLPDDAAAIAAAQELLNRIEDLSDAFQIRGGARRWSARNE